jgi:predicted N-acetyltransferase YhbS
VKPYIIRQIQPTEYPAVRRLDRDAFGFNERDSDPDFHEVFADNIRRSPYFIQELDLIAVANDGVTSDTVTDSGVILGHGIFSALPMGDEANHIAWLHSLAVRHGEADSHADKSYEYQRKGIGTAIVRYGIKIAKTLGYTVCMCCGHPDVYRKKMGFADYRDFGITKDGSVHDPDEAIHALELVPNGFTGTNKRLTYSYYDFEKAETCA